MGALLVLVGLAAVVGLALDVLWTVAAAGSGAGPLTGRLSSFLWRLALLAGSGPEGPRHKFLSRAGLSVIVTMLVAWIALVIAAWWLVFSATDGAVRRADDQRPASVLDRLHFTGANIFTLGSDEFVAGSGAWQFAKVGATATGVVFLTLAVTYLVPAASAVAERRQFASYVASLGSSPAEVLATAWTGSDFGSLPQHLVALTPMVHLLGEQHLAYPVLHYFHAEQLRTSAATNMVVLDEAVTLLRVGVAPDVRPDAAAVLPLARAVRDFLDTMQSAFIVGADEPVPSTSLDPVREAGIPTVSDEEFTEAMADDLGHRCLLATLLVDDGWSMESWRKHGSRADEDNERS